MSSEQSNENHNGIESSADQKKGYISMRDEKETHANTAHSRARSGRLAIQEDAKKEEKKRNRAKAKTEDSPAVTALRAEQRKERAKSPCNAMLASRIGTLKRMRWPAEDAFIAISALRTEHQGGSSTKSSCRKKCLHSDERLAGMITAIYEAPTSPWNDDFQRVEYLKRKDINADEAFMLLLMSQLTDPSGYCKAFYSLNELVGITHMNKAGMTKVIYEMHNKGIITYRKGHRRKGSEYWLHNASVTRRPEDVIEVPSPTPPKKKGRRKTRETGPKK